MNHNLARTLMGFVLTKAVTPPCGKWNRLGQEPSGMWRAISRNVLTAWISKSHEMRNEIEKGKRWGRWPGKAEREGELPNMAETDHHQAPGRMQGPDKG